MKVGARLREAVDGRSRHVDAAEPHALEQIRHPLVEAGLRDRGRRVEREEALGQDDELRTLACRVVHQPDRFLQARLEVEHDRGRLHGGDAHQVEGRHVGRVTQARRAVKARL